MDDPRERSRRARFGSLQVRHRLDDTDARGGTLALRDESRLREDAKSLSRGGLAQSSIQADEAVAAGLVDLDPADSVAIGGGTAVPGAPIAILSPGTGLGMACVVLGPSGRCVVTSEGGHASIAGMDDNYDKIVAAIRRRHGRVSAERVLSGAGLANLHQAIAELLPTRLEFYEAWISPEGMREGRVTRAPLTAVISFLRQEGAAYDAVMAAGGSPQGEIIQKTTPAGGMATAVYVRDPEGNIIELSDKH